MRGWLRRHSIGLQGSLFPWGSWLPNVGVFIHSTKASHSCGVSYSSHQGERCKSDIIAEEILIFTFVCAFGIFENSPAKFKPPIALFELMANHIAFNPTLATVRIWPGHRGGRDNLLGIRILQSWPAPGESSSTIRKVSFSTTRLAIPSA